MKVPFFSFDKRNTDVKTEALSVFESFFESKWYVLGKNTTAFEENFASFCNTKHAVGVSTGLDALHLALIALGVGKGDEVIVPSNTYIATVLAVSYTGAIPVFVEPRLETSNINPELLEKAITKDTKCIIPVHLYGQACEMDRIMEIAVANNLYVIEDNAQAHGAKFKGRKTGSFGHINATSFYPTKNIGALGEAGAVTTDSEDYALQIKVLRNYGSHIRYYNDIIGYNSRIDEFEAAYLNVALKYIDQWTKERERIAKWYDTTLKNLKEFVQPVEIVKGATSVYHLYVIRAAKRDNLRKYLAEHGVETQIHYPVPPHLQKAYSHLNYKKGDFPVAEELADTVLSLPIWPGMTETQIEYISSRIQQYFHE